MIPTKDTRLLGNPERCSLEKKKEEKKVNMEMVLMNKIAIGKNSFLSFCPDRIGKHNDIPDSAFDPKELALGIKTESEHTDNPHIAKGIAKDHLMEFSDYYTRLRKARL